MRIIILFEQEQAILRIITVHRRPDSSFIIRIASRPESQREKEAHILLIYD